jgi:hypothetical protein
MQPERFCPLRALALLPQPLKLYIRTRHSALQDFHLALLHDVFH